MTIDKAKLKALAEAATQSERKAEKCIGGIPHVITEEWDIAEVHVTTGANPMADAEFMAAASPATVLALLAEIERGKRLFDQSERALDRVNAMWHRRWLNRTGEPYPIPALSRDEEFDQLKAENEALRKDAERYRWLRDGEYLHAWADLHVCDEHRRAELTDRAIDTAMPREASHG